MKYLYLIWRWIKSIFNFKKPILSRLDYAGYIIEGKSYFVFSWEMKNAYQLNAKSVGYKTFLKSGSAYMAVTENQNHIEIILSGSWRKRKYLIKLKRIILDVAIDFPISMNNHLEVKLNMPSLKSKFSTLKVYSFNSQLVNDNQIKKIINISYPN